MKTLLAVPFLAFLVGCAQPETAPAPPRAPGDGRANLIVFGDSVSYCQTCFPSLIAAALPNMKVDNRAEPGTELDSEWQLGRILVSIVDPGDKVIFLTGYNDLRGYGADATHFETYKAALRKALEHLATSGQPIYVGTTEMPLCIDAASITRNGNGCNPGAHAMYVQAIKDEVARMPANVHLVDVASQWVGSYDNLSDMVHPNAFGHTQMAGFFLRQM